MCARGWKGDRRYPMIDKTRVRKYVPKVNLRHSAAGRSGHVCRAFTVRRAGGTMNRTKWIDNEYVS